MNRDQGFVYAIQPIGMDCVKIGTTNNPTQRALSLAAYSPVPLVFRHLLQVETKRVGCVFEADILGWSMFATGWGEWRTDLDLVDDLFACVAPAVCVRDEYTIQRGKTKGGARLHPDETHGRADVAVYMDMARGNEWDARSAIGLHNQPTECTVARAREKLAHLRNTSVSEAS